MPQWSEKGNLGVLFTWYGYLCAVGIKDECMDKVVRDALERHFQAIKSAKGDKSFFVGIAEFVGFIKKVPLLQAMAAELEMQNGLTDDAQNDWQERIDWFSEPRSVSETWERMLFVHRIYFSGERLLKKSLSDPSERRRSMHTKNAIGAFNVLQASGEGVPLSLGIPFFRREVYEAGLNGVYDFFVDVTNIRHQHEFIRKIGENYYYEGRLLDIGKTNIRSNVFAIVFEFHDQNGFISYEKIEAELRCRGCKAYAYGKQSVTRIHNALNEHQGLFKYGKVGGCSLKNENPDGQPLIDIIRGKGIQFNNRRLI